MTKTIKKAIVKKYDCFFAYIRIGNFDKDTLKTLNLYNDDNGFNNAAGLLADKNHFPGILLRTVLDFVPLR